MNAFLWFYTKFFSIYLEANYVLRFCLSCQGMIDFQGVIRDLLKIEIKGTYLTNLLKHPDLSTFQNL